MISRVRFHNFKALASVTVELERLTVLVGANATGKTSVLDGLHALCRLGTHQLHEAEDPLGRAGRIFRGRLSPGKLRTLGGEDFVTIDVTGDVAASCTIGVGYADGPPINFLIAIKKLQVCFPNATGPQIEKEEVFRQFTASGLGHAVYLHLDPARLSEPSYVEDERPRVRADGFGLASVLALLGGERSEALDRIESDLRRIIPRARRLRTSPSRVQRSEFEVVTVNGSSQHHQVERSYMGQRFELELEGVGWIAADMLSEGTLLVLGVLTVLHTTPALKLLLLDDLDRGLHPHAQREVVTSLRAVMDQNPQLQVVCTTHSPYALDVFAPEEVRVMKLDSRGHAHCKSLTDHPDWPKWKDFMKAGEFWSSVGEAWVYGDADDA